MTPTTKPPPLSIHFELVLAVKLDGEQVAEAALSQATAYGIDNWLVPGAGVQETLIFVIFKVAVEFPKKSPQAGVRSRLAKGGGSDGKTPSEHKLAELLTAGKLPTCPKKTPAAKRLGDPEEMDEITSKVIDSPAVHEVIVLPAGCEKDALAVKSLAVQPRFLPARVPIQA